MNRLFGLALVAMALVNMVAAPLVRADNENSPRRWINYAKSQGFILVDAQNKEIVLEKGAQANLTDGYSIVASASDQKGERLVAGIRFFSTDGGKSVSLVLTLGSQDRVDEMREIRVFAGERKSPEARIRSAIDSMADSYSKKIRHTSRSARARAVVALMGHVFTAADAGLGDEATERRERHVKNTLCALVTTVGAILATGSIASLLWIVVKDTETKGPGVGLVKGTLVFLSSVLGMFIGGALIAAGASEWQH